MAPRQSGSKPITDLLVQQSRWSWTIAENKEIDHFRLDLAVSLSHFIQWEDLLLRTHGVDKFSRWELSVEKEPCAKRIAHWKNMFYSFVRFEPDMLRFMSF